MPASSSMADRRARMAFFSARSRPPTAMTVVDTTCMAMGMHAMRMTMVVLSASKAVSPDSKSLM